MKNKKIVTIALFSILIFMLSCTKDFIVKDIKNESLTINSPTDNLKTPINNVTFWWDELDGAEKYNIQIVKPNFSSMIQLIVDTTVTSTKFNKTLSPGIYQWRIKAINAGGSTAYFTRSLTIDTTSNLSLLTVNPISPINYLTSNKIINFSWSPLTAADYYEIKILNATDGIVYNQSNIVGSSFTYTFTTNTDLLNYKWQVKAHNDFSFSQYNSPNTFSIDITSPVVSQIISPVNGVSRQDSVYFKWNRVSTDTKYDSIIVSLDSLGSSHISSRRVNDTRLQINQLAPSLSVPGPTSGYYWWRIISVDSVKNKSNSSTSAKFKLIQ